MIFILFFLKFCTSEVTEMKIKQNKSEDFESCILNHNLDLSHITSIFLIIFNAIPLIIHSIDSSSLIVDNIFINTTNTVNTINIIFFTIWLLIHKVILNRYNTRLEYNLLFNIFLFCLTYLTLCTCIYSLIISKSISYYLLLIFILNLFFFIDIKKFIFIVLLPSTIYIYAMFKVFNYTESFWINLFSLILYLSLIIYFSILKFKLIKHSFNSNQQLLLAKSKLEIANNKLMVNEKERTNFFADVSHELKTPINVIYSANQLLTQQLKNPSIDLSRTEHYVDCIKRNSFRLIRLINNLLDVTKIESSNFKIKLENINIVYAIENIVDSVVDFVKSKGINIIFDTTTEEKITAVDEDKLERIILNILSNAIKFTDPGGTIFINISEDINNTIVSIRDTGIGIDDSMKKVIFERFVQIDKSISRNSEGTGIGLSLVKSLMVLHGGDITLDSEVGKGSEFKLYFPNQTIESDRCTNLEYTPIKSYNNKIERIEIEFSDIYK